MVFVLPSLFIFTLLQASHLAYAGNPHNGDGGSSLKDKIKVVVVLIEENRSVDNILSGLTYTDQIDGAGHTKFCNPVNLTDPSQGEICATPNATNVDADDPNHSVSGINLELFGTFHPTSASPETMMGFVAEQELAFNTTNRTRAAEVITFYNEKDIPTIAAMSENYVVFDRWFCSVPGPTDPNRAYITSGTSYGHGQNDNDFNIHALPQKSIFQQLSENNITWKNYFNSSFPPDAEFYNWTFTSGANVTNVIPLDQFFKDAAAGNLPQFVYINPECCSVQSFHPPSSMTDGQTFLKQIYEALRNSPQWDELLYIVSFDEAGGYADHVPPPTNVPPGDNLTYTETAPDGKNVTFDFTRLGVRVPTWLISPWVGKGIVEHEGQNSGGTYSHTSIIHFVENLFGLEPLTPRVADSATFEHLILDKKRETVKDLPNPIEF